MEYQLIDLDELDDNKEFCCGERFRVYNVGLASYGANTDQDYADYMLVENHYEYLLVVNIGDGWGNGKTGFVLCYVNKKANFNVVLGKEIKLKMGNPKVFWLKEIK
jgi:hypothetical protein